MVCSTLFRTLKPAKTMALALQKLLNHALVSLHLLDDMTIECTFPKFSFSKKPLVQKCVNLEHVFPCFQELLL